MAFGFITQKIPIFELPRISQIVNFTFSGITRDIGCFPLEQENSLKLHFPNFCFTVYIHWEKKKVFIFHFYCFTWAYVRFLQPLGEVTAKHFFLHNENNNYREENIHSTGRKIVFTRLLGQGEDGKGEFFGIKPFFKSSFKKYNFCYHLKISTVVWELFSPKNLKNTCRKTLCDSFGGKQNMLKFWVYSPMYLVLSQRSKSLLDIFQSCSASSCTTQPSFLALQTIQWRQYCYLRFSEPNFSPTPITKWS